jgi:DNA-binding Lrp family transcriptional regulator
VDEDTIRKRIDRLESSGLLNGWGILPNPNVLGLKLGAVYMKVGPRIPIEETVRKIRLVRGVLSVIRQVGDVLGVGLLCENEKDLQKKVELLSELSKPTELEVFLVNHPKAGIELTKADWQIINALRPNPTASYVDVAESLGLSSKTVKRRLDRLVQSNAVYFFPKIDFRRIEGASCVDLFVTYSDSRLKTEVDRSIFMKFEEYAFRAGWGSEAHGHFEFLIPNVRIAQEIVDWARSLPGVKDVKTNFIFDLMNFYDDALDEVFVDKVGSRSVSRT